MICIIIMLKVQIKKITNDNNVNVDKSTNKNVKIDKSTN